VNNRLNEIYQNEIKFKQYKLYSYINKRRSEDNLINTIRKKFKKDKKELIMIIGDWSISKQQRNFISTPNLGIKRKLKEHFKVYNIDEFRTSCLHNKTEDYCKNLYLNRNKKMRKMHPILTYQMAPVNRKAIQFLPWQKPKPSVLQKIKGKVVSIEIKMVVLIFRRFLIVMLKLEQDQKNIKDPINLIKKCVNLLTNLDVK